MSDLPEIPDAAFDAVVRQIATFLEAAPAGRQPNMDALCESVGLRGSRDKRQWDLGAAIVAADTGIDDFDGNQLPPREVQATVLGMTTGLLLAQASGWEPPIG